MQRSDFSLGMSLGFGHKSHWIHIFQLGHGFCPREWRTLSRPCKPTSPSWSALSGAAERLVQRPFDWCTPTMSHAQQRTHTHSRAHTLHLALYISPHAQHNALGPHQTKIPMVFIWKVMVSPLKMAAQGPEGCNAWTANPPFLQWTLLYENYSNCVPESAKWCTK